MNGRLDAAAARGILLVKAYDDGPPDNPLWTPEDRVWATRLAAETTPADAAPERFVAERAGHALQRLRPRDPAAASWLARPLWRGRWLALAIGGAALLGVALDDIGGSRHVNLLAPPVWAVIAWNLLVYVALAWPRKSALAGRRGLRAWLGRRLAGQARRGPVLASVAASWARTALPLTTARATLLLHAAAASLALGLIAGLYLRGLVFDYRAGWQSTFLDAAQARAALALLLAPASALTGIAIPDVATLQALRIGPDSAPTASAAPWLHLYAAMLAICVLAPRSGLALLAGWRARRLAARFPLALDDPYFQRLLRQWRRQPAGVQVVPHGAAPAWSALAGLKAILAAGLGAEPRIEVARATAYGDEDGAETLAPPPDTSLRVVLVDLASTPEDEAHGRFVRALRAAAPNLPMLLVGDETALRRRYASLPQRLAERRAAWQHWAEAQDLGFVPAALDDPDMPRASAALEQALRSGERTAGAAR